MSSDMKARFPVHLALSISWFMKAVSSVEALCLSLGHLFFESTRRNISVFKQWFGENKQILGAIAFIVAIIYFILFTSMLEDRWKTIVGIVLQIVAGAILVLEQILANDRIKDQTARMIQKPAAFALLMTFISLPFAASVLTALGEVPSNRWSAALGVTVGTILVFGAFLTSVALLQRIGWLRSKDYVPGANDRLDVSNLSLRNVGILFGGSVSIMVLLICLARFAIPGKALWIQTLWFILLFIYGFTLLPLLIIAPLYFLAFQFARFTMYIRTKKSLEVWFWIVLFVLWAWGWLLLLLREFT